MDDYYKQIEFVKKELRDTPHHKGTDHYIGKLRARLARLNDKIYESSGKKGGGKEGFAVKKFGDATVVLVGPPSVGKSTLLNSLTNAKSKVAAYEFTTLNVVPGMMIYNDAYIQIFDIPGLIRGAQKGKGRGKEVLSVVRTADLIVIITDIKRINLVETMISELEESGVRINKERPNVRIEKKTQGGLDIKSNIKQELSNETIKEVAYEFGIRDADITLKEKVSIDQLIDSFSSNRTYKKAILVVNKIDEVKNIPNLKSSFETILISARDNIGLEKLRESIWKNLNMVKIYLVEEKNEPDFSSPIIVKEGYCLTDVLEKMGSSFIQRYTLAKIWGGNARFQGQEVPLSHKVVEGLQVRFI